MGRGRLQRTTLVTTMSALIRLVGSRTTTSTCRPLPTSTSTSQGASPACNDRHKTVLAPLPTLVTAQLSNRSEGPAVSSLPVAHCGTLTEPRGAVNSPVGARKRIRLWRPCRGCVVGDHRVAVGRSATGARSAAESVEPPSTRQIRASGWYENMR